MAHMQPLIINLAPTGMVPTRMQSCYVPLTPQEIGADVARCAALGVSMVHLHARAEDGTPTEALTVYERIIDEVRTSNPEIVVIVSTSGRLINEAERRATALYLEGRFKPDMASLTLGSMNFATSASVNDPKTITLLAKIMQERGIRPELEVFDTGMVNFAKILIDKGLITPPFYFNILLGNPSTAQATLLHLATIINDLPPQSIWSLAGIGRFQTRANALGVVLGNGVRVGLEDNLWLDEERTQLATNAQLVQRVINQAEALNRAIATPQTVRRMLSLDLPQ
ncbi:3-keto-5-aminohexanoate cleavage protein [Candidatus Methylobacter oryzae]|uniref:3-keto-5-aminohexanoate cleavage protein n=1 Tax=Candidatus Methylobacter oryzae TaxID=2497749 RepID=A0ABY3C664_9GAMM|nr:3-keto-5-aminohexanoate cleavage protein [Candidatus Methylobacter oryzae]TRW90343.1 3-keto-5-aminohexanoate cleavage protein [Candidatus Methylobacter oryzae]